MIDKNPLKIKEMFNKISEKYDFLNNIISFGLHGMIKRIAFKNLKINKEAKILDLCTGTGDIAHILRQVEKDAEIFGVDFSSNMLEIGKKRFKDDNINFIEGDVCALDFKDDFFDIATISFGLRNIKEKEKALFEINRVLKIDGLFAHLDFSCQNKFLNFIFDKFTLIFSRYLSENYEAYKYLINSKNEFKSPDELVKEFELSGFKCIFKKNYLFNTIGFQICKKSR